MKSQILGRINSPSNIIQFPTVNNQKWIPFPNHCRPSDRFDEYICFNDSLEDLGIFDGHKLTCRTSFDLSEIKPKTLCIVIYPGADSLSAKLVTIDSQKLIVTIYGANKRFQSVTLPMSKVEILAIVEEIRRPIKGGKIIT